MLMNYWFEKQVNSSFEQARERTIQVLSTHGFGVLTEINVQETIKKKLDEDMNRYSILGACNPLFAHQALLAETHIGLLLPCNVIIYEDEGQVFVAAIRPQVAMNIVDNDKLTTIAGQVEEELSKVIEEI
jgi:uncharacterized protein (DUF302 family)